MYKAIQIGIVSRYHINLLAGHSSIKKTPKLLAQKYYWPTLCHNVEAYVKGCDACLASKTIRHKPYSDLQSLPVPTYQWKDLLINFVASLLISTN